MKSKPIAVSFCTLLLAMGTARSASAQTGPAHLPFDSVALNDSSAFRAPGANWRLVGNVVADRNHPLRVHTSGGSGVLVNLAPVGKGSNLVTEWEHGDLELELDFMMPKGGNSGVYLQGRYELQLLDSWGVKTPRFSDAGGIYQRWDPQRGAGREGFEGVSPRVNASRAPGLWQHLRILFRAPRFDAKGNKIANARFVRVEHNGVVIHENVQVTGPTRGAMFQDEQPAGPLMIQGDHGPVALRGVRFKRYSGQRVGVSDLRYRAYVAESGEVAKALGGVPVAEGIAEGISSAVATAQDKFALAFSGTMDIPTAGLYRYEMLLDWVDSDPHFNGVVLGGGKLMIGGREVLVHGGRQPGASGEVELKAGKHPFSLTFYKNRPWTDRTGIGLFVEGPEVQRHALHVTTGRPVQIAGAITVQPEGEATVLRSFVQHRDTKRTHAVSVGDPTGVHYSYDLARGALLQAWRGPFLETTPMWHDRGNAQIAEPLGSVLVLPGAPALAFLVDGGTAWPDSTNATADYAFRGYALDALSRPVFTYQLRDVEVQDRLLPAADSASLRRELRVRGPDSTSGLYVRLAAGDKIRRISNDAFAIGDLRYYVAPGRGAPRPIVREQDGQQELLVPVRLRRGEANLSYTITW